MKTRLWFFACLMVTSLFVSGALLLLVPMLSSVDSFSFQKSNALAEELVVKPPEERLVRVAFPQVQGLSMINDEGVRSGVLYDWLVEIAKYTGWSYEFIDGEAEDLISATNAGDIDLIGNMFYRQQLEEGLDYSRFSTGANHTLILSDSSNDEIKSFDLRTLNGKTIGVYENATDKIRRLQNFIDFNGLTSEILPLDREAYLRCVQDGTADAMLGSDVDSLEGYTVVAEFDSEPHYLAISKKSNIQEELNLAMQHIYEADSEFATALYDKYFTHEYGNILKLNDEDKTFVAQSDVIKVSIPAVQYPLFYQRYGIEKGIVNDLFDHLSKKTDLKFEYVQFATYKEALEAVKSGRTDLMGSFMDSDSDASAQGLVRTKPYVSLGEVTLRSKIVPSLQGKTVVAQIAGQRPSGAVVGSETVFFDTYEACLDAVNSGRADYTVMPSSFAEGLFMNKAYVNVTPTASSRQQVDISIVVPESADSALYAVLNKAINSMSDAETNAIVSSNTIPAQGRPVTLESVMSENPLLFVGVLFVLFIFIGIISAVIGVSKIRQHVIQIKLEKAEETGRAKSDFLSRMSHEIRTPMNAIIGLSNVASLSGEATPAIRSSLEKINSSAQFLLSLVNDVLDMAKIENGKMSITTAPLSLCQLAEKMDSMFSIQSEEKGISLIASCQSKTVVIGDDVRLQQVLTNLLSNALKFTDPGKSIELSIEEIASADEVVTVRFCVNDSGAGIREEDMERIFASFEQAAENRRNAQGTGLGLAISNNLVHLMGGKLEVQSTLGQGASFFFVLNMPVGDKVDHACSLAGKYDDIAGEESVDQHLLEGAHILLAEDNDLNAEIAVALLELENMVVDRAANGGEAVDMFIQSEFGYYDFILMDVQMPVMNGHEATAKIRNLDRQDAQTIPIVALTANTFQEDRDNATRVGMDAFIPKPFDARQLYGVLRSLRGPKKHN